LSAGGLPSCAAAVNAQNKNENRISIKGLGRHNGEAGGFPETPGLGHIRRRQCARGTAKTISGPESRGEGQRGKPLTSVYPADTATRRGYTASARRDAERVYRAALRHSRLVRWLRIGVPAVIGAALLAVVAVNYMPTVGGLRLPGEVGELLIKGTKVTMEQPRLAGFTMDSRPYEFSANSAEQDITKPDLMELHQIQAKVEMEDKSAVNITSNSGTYDMKTEMMTLTESVHIVSSTGYEVRLTDAVIDVHKGNVVSEKPVWVKLTKGVLTAKRVEVIDGGDLIRFGGGVSMTVQPDQDSQQANEQ
jgi:lipopolysaccharide export system protein LptC